MAVKVLVIYGGESSEREISLLSGNNVGKALVNAGYEVTYFDPKIGIDKLPSVLKNIDVAFPILHGTGGEDGFIQKALEKEGAKFIGSSSEVSASCFDKWQTIQKAKHILFPKSEIVTSETLEQSDLVGKPFVIKPCSEGSSVDTFIIRDPAVFNVLELGEVFKRHYNELLLQELIEGVEVTVAVLGETALPVVEIIPPTGQDFDFVNKYNGATVENCPPKHVSEDMQKKAQTIALDLHKTMGCRGFSRTDIIIDNNNSLYTLEINTLPGMTSESLFPRAAKSAGISMQALVSELVEKA